MYSNEDYCLDYLVDYCSFGGIESVELKVIVHDVDYRESSKASTIFGSSRDSHASRKLKQIGYPVSILFLAATLVVFVILPDLGSISSTLISKLES